MNNLTHSPSPQWKDIGVVNRDEMLEDIPSKYPNMTELDIYCQTILHKVEIGDGVELALEHDLDPEEDLDWEHENDFGLELQDNHEPQLAL